MVRKSYKTVNTFFTLVVVFLLGYLVWDTLNTEPYIYNKKSPSVPQKKEPKKAANQTGEKLNTLDYYLERVNRRNIFLPINVVINTVIEKEPEEPKIPIGNLIKDIKVVGYSLGDPLMVMIEDGQNGRTHFLSEGDAISDDLTIKSIVEDGVIVTNGEEEIKIK